MYIPVSVSVSAVTFDLPERLKVGDNLGKSGFADTAKEDLRNIAVYLAEQAGAKEPAIRFVNELREKVRILESFPESGSIPDDRILKSAGFRFLVCKEYLFFYQYDKKENAVYLLAFFNAKRDYTRVMRRFVRK